MRLFKGKKTSLFNRKYVISVIFIFFFYYYFASFYKPDVQYILTRPYSFVCNMLEESFDYFKMITQKDKENLKLLAENKRLTHEIDQLKFKLLSVQFDTELVPVLQYHDNGYNKNLLISDKKFKQGDIVVSGNQLVGRITSIGNKIAVVKLISDHTSKIPVKIQELNAIAVGSGKETLILKHFDGSYQHLDKNLPVITSGVDGLFPKNMHIGSIYSDKANVCVKIPIRFDKLAAVQVIRYVDIVEVAEK